MQAWDNITELEKAIPELEQINSYIKENKTEKGDYEIRVLLKNIKRIHIYKIVEYDDE